MTQTDTIRLWKRHNTRIQNHLRLRTHLTEKAFWNLWLNTSQEYLYLQDCPMKLKYIHIQKWKLPLLVKKFRLQLNKWRMEIHPENIKRTSIKLHRPVANIFLEVAMTGNYPNKLKTIILTPLRKPNKKLKRSAVLDHLWSIMPLLDLQKVLTIQRLLTV